jgi:hypothetical protein
MPVLLDRDGGLSGPAARRRNLPLFVQRDQAIGLIRSGY